MVIEEKRPVLYFFLCAVYYGMKEGIRLLPGIGILEGECASGGNLSLLRIEKEDQKLDSSDEFVYWIVKSPTTN